MAEPHVEEVIQGHAETAQDVDLALTPDEEAFLLGATGLPDASALRAHILRVQSDAAEVFPYPCIRRFDFVKLKISNLPCYDRLLSLPQQHPDALLLDIGCCFGTDIRKAIADGFPAHNIIGSDLRPEFWDIGHKLFQTDPGTFPVTFLAGDVLAPSFTGYDPICSSTPATQAPALKSLATLAPLAGRVHAVHASNFFHLFSEANQAAVARTLGALLAPVRGAMLFGTHVGRPVMGFRTEAPPPAPGYLGNRMFCHDAQSWAALWDGEVFEKGTVKVEAKVVEQSRDDLVVLQPGVTFYQLIWCVTRL
ncbi:S-adenosyl-L-methionine-dependent methyltransferase [Phanerochaete sordida]|uniref:S-adenosyl-L-methionine-dependent methyltransferase n=1 Tax=Phanerochaete sordida TaxID=48140 RepID=A0A9P3GSH0_9APHY|nr:S-adenosyl-L-methionine-dependent methyltransferase [Phanerochaete sordida]